MSFDCRVRIYGIKDPKATWITIKDAIKKYGDPSYINYRPGDSEGVMQFGSDKERKAFVKEVRDLKIRLNDHKVKFEELDRESEERFIKRSQRNKKKSFGERKPYGSHKPRRF